MKDFTRRSIDFQFVRAQFELQPPCGCCGVASRYLSVADYTRPVGGDHEVALVCAPFPDEVFAINFPPDKAQCLATRLEVVAREVASPGSTPTGYWAMSPPLMELVPCGHCDIGTSVVYLSDYLSETGEHFVAVGLYLEDVPYHPILLRSSEARCLARSLREMANRVEFLGVVVSPMALSETVGDLDVDAVRKLNDFAGEK